MAQKQPVPNHCNSSCQYYLGVLFKCRGQAVCAPNRDRNPPKPDLENTCYLVIPGQKCVNEGDRIYTPK